jgi:hypothetical protein
MARSAVYYVADNKSILVRVKQPGKDKLRRIALKGGKGRDSIVPNDVIERFGKDEIKRLLKTGFLMRKGGEDDQEPEEELMVTHEGKVDEAPPAPPRAPGLWNIDPKKLKGKKLDDLNVMIAEKDASKPPCATIAEAIKQLSADFEG